MWLHPHQSNGQVENLNRRVEHVLRVMILDAKLGQPSKNNWSVLLPMVRGIINSKLVHRHGCSANDLLYGATSQREGIFEDEPWNLGVGPCVASVEADGPAAERAAATVQQWREQHPACMSSKVSYFTLEHAGRTLLLREHGLIPHSAAGSRRAPPRRCTTAQAGAIPALAGTV